MSQWFSFYYRKLNLVKYQHDVLLLSTLHNIYMVSTHSKSKNMFITSEMREYFENLMKPLVTNEKLEQSIKSFQEGLMKKIEEKFENQYKRIEELESRLALKQNIDNLEKKVR